MEYSFNFFLITHRAIETYFFNWDKPDYMFIDILNTICSWDFVQGWNDNEYHNPVGQAIVFNDKIMQDVTELRKSFLSSKNNNHKQLISSLHQSLSTLKTGDLFFIYRVTRTYPQERLLYKILNELTYIKGGRSKGEADAWFNENAAGFFQTYHIEYYKHFKRGELKRAKRVCRFCSRSMPEVKFEKTAHAIPESIGGSKNLVCYEECDICNDSFGKGIERNLCEWFDLRRSSNLVTKKSGGVAKAYGRNYVIEGNNASFFLSSEYRKKIKAISSGIVTLQGIYRALSKIALDLIDTKHLARLKTTIEWVRFGEPKSAEYPPIAQMVGLNNIKEPIVYIFTRRDGTDDNTPLHICILRIFNLALLYALPHVDGKMIFPKDYTNNIPTEALKVLGFTGEWIWERYNTTEKRNPHIEIDLSKAEITPTTRTGEDVRKKLRIEKKPNEDVEFPLPVLTLNDIYNYRLELIRYTYTSNINHITGKLSTQAIIDLDKNVPLFLRLNFIFRDVRTSGVKGVIAYSVQAKPYLLIEQMKIYNNSSLSISQELFAQILEKAIEHLFKEIIPKYKNCPCTQEGLEINNVREIMGKMQIFLMQQGKLVETIKGCNIWHTGY